jgi:hypothetical protein
MFAVSVVLVGCASSAQHAARHPTAPGPRSNTAQGSTTVTGATTAPSIARRVLGPGAFDTADALLDQRVRAACEKPPSGPSQDGTTHACTIQPVIFMADRRAQSPG